jgi:hypothetical protein
MKKLSTLFSFIGFMVQYVAPLILFGDIIPYVRDHVGVSLTWMGYIAIGIFLFFVSKRLKEKVLEKPKSIIRAVLLSIFPIVWWLILFIGMSWISTLFLKVATYWKNIIYFIIIGRGFYIAAEAVCNIEPKHKENK